MQRNEKTTIIPERFGECRIKIDAKLPSGDMLKIDDVIFNVVE